MITYEITRQYYNTLRNIYDGKGRVVKILTDKEVINYLNQSAGFKGEITSLNVH